MCGYHLENGQPHEAAAYAERALALLPDDMEIRWCATRAFLADGQLDKVLRIAQRDQRGLLAIGMEGYSEEVCVHCTRGQREQAAKLVEQLRERLRSADPEIADECVRGLQSQIEYCMGNTAEFIRILEPTDDPTLRLMAHLTGGDMEAAEKDVADQQVDWRTHVLIYLAAVRYGRSDQAEKHLAAAADMLAEQRFEDRAIADALRGRPNMPLEKLLRLRWAVDDKLLLVTALGVRDPASREACFELARKLNFDRRFPHLLLSDILNGRTASR